MTRGGEGWLLQTLSLRSQCGVCGVTTATTPAIASTTTTPSNSVHLSSDFHKLAAGEEHHQIPPLPSPSPSIENEGRKNSRRQKHMEQTTEKCGIDGALKLLFAASMEMVISSTTVSHELLLVTRAKLSASLVYFTLCTVCQNTCFFPHVLLLFLGLFSVLHSNKNFTVLLTSINSLV